MAKSYTVTWKIELYADSHKEAAELALEIHRDKYSEATFFDVTEEATGVEMSIELLENNDE